MTKWICQTALFASLMLSTPWLQAAEPQSGQNCPDFETLDKNHDSFISRDEGFADENVSKYWDQLDSNTDSSLTRTEFSQLEKVVERQEELRTDHPVSVQQYEKGKYISPEQQIERNQQEREKE